MPSSEIWLRGSHKEVSCKVELHATIEGCLLRSLSIVYDERKEMFCYTRLVVKRCGICFYLFLITGNIARCAYILMQFTILFHEFFQWCSKRLFPLVFFKDWYIFSYYGIVIFYMPFLFVRALKVILDVQSLSLVTDVSLAVQNPSSRNRQRVLLLGTTRGSCRTRRGSVRSSTRTATPPRLCTTQSVNAGTTPPSMNVSSGSLIHFLLSYQPW